MSKEQILDCDAVFNKGVMVRAVFFQGSSGRLVIVIQHAEDSNSNISVVLPKKDYELLGEIFKNPPETAALYLPAITMADALAAQETGELPFGFSPA